MPSSFDFFEKWDKKDKPRPALAKIFFFSNRIEEPRPREREDCGFSFEADGSLVWLDDTEIQIIRNTILSRLAHKQSPNL